jgi:hypothetical protein
VTASILRGAGVGSLALILAVLVTQTAWNLGWPTWVGAGLGAWTFLAALAVGKP